MTPHLKTCCDPETVQMKGHNIWFRYEIEKNVFMYSFLSRTMEFVQGEKFKSLRVDPRGEKKQK